ncbi:MAG: hypothetical protein PHP52_11885 [Bacteroidales bacterium]|nr:hypothetical protein [Bacteroidales bacterium]
MEIYFDENEDWFIEFNTSNFASGISYFDRISLESSSGIAEIKSGIQLTDSTVFLTNDSLLTSLQINPLGDYIKIVAPQGVNLFDVLGFQCELYYYFGDYQFSHVSALSIGQSYCISENDSFVSFLTKCNSPTIGYSNSSQAYYGDLIINLLDENEEPLAGVNCFLEQRAFN